jgi:nitronate monooxygenase
VSFHFGLPATDLLERVKSWGATVLASATTVKEAQWLESHGADGIIAQGLEAGGHRGIFLSGDFTPRWCGQNSSGWKEISAAELTRELAADL